MKKSTIFIIRALMGAFFAVILTRFFLPDSGWTTAVGVAVLLIFLAYVFEYLRGRRSDE
jgi:dipeptide/tripeptide permease